MKEHDKMKKIRKQNAKGNGQKSQSLRIEFIHPTALTVAIAGTFNEWRPESTPMVALGNGRWLKDIVLPPGTYEYLIVVDGDWIPDPAVKQTAPKPYGGVNSVVSVTSLYGQKQGDREPLDPSVTPMPGRTYLGGQIAKKVD